MEDCAKAKSRAFDCSCICNRNVIGSIPICESVLFACSDMYFCRAHLGSTLGRLLKRAAFLHRTYEDAGVLHLLKPASDAGLHQIKKKLENVQKKVGKYFSTHFFLHLYKLRIIDYFFLEFQNKDIKQNYE